ncbi:MAG TPA: DUF1854 domain-containing protein [Rhodocyclaceae bacterium]|jgi:hypothetical protein
MSNNFQLERDVLGRLIFTAADGEVHVGVVPVRAFPIGQPDRGISLVSPDGHELAWIDQLTDLPEPLRTLVQDELSSREFMPEIRQLLAVSTFATPSTWAVETDRGTVDFVLKGEEDIRRINGPTLLISDSHGIHYLIRDQMALNRVSRKLLDRFL